MRQLLCIGFLFFICLISCTQSQAPVVLFGRTTSKAGFGAAYLTGPDRAMEMWEDVVNQQGGILIGGTKYTVEVKTYNDASDRELVDLVIPAAAIADKYRIPMINPYPSISAQMPVNNFTFHIFFPMEETATSCGQLFAAKGAKTALIAFQPALNLFAGFVNASFMKSNITVLPAEPLSVVPAEIPHQVKQWKSQRPDVFIGCAVDPQSTAKLLLSELFKQRFFPQAVYMFTAPNAPEFRESADWQGVHVFASATWHSSLNSSDPVFNNSLQFDAEFRRRYNTSSAELDAGVATAGVVFVQAIENAGSLDRDLVRNALANIDMQTLFGHISFYKNGTTTGKWKCFQEQQDRSLKAVYPKENSQITVVEPVYPGNPPIPGGYYKHHYALRNGLLIGGCLLLALVAAVVVIVVVARGRYHVIFVPKQPGENEWS